MEKGLLKTSKKKILIFSVAYYPYLIGGAEIAVKEITDRLEDEFEFDMVTLYVGDSRIEKIGNVNVYRVGPKIKSEPGKNREISHVLKIVYMACALLKSIQLQRVRNYDFTWSIMASFSGFVALFFKMIYQNIPFLLTLQEGDSLEHIEKSFGITYPLSKPLYKKIFKKADRIQVISNFLGKYAKDMGATCDIEVVPNAVDFKLFGSEQSSGHMKALKSELGIMENDIVLITTSRLVVKNAVGDIIDALSFLPENIKLLILGIGSQEKLLKEKVKLLKLQDRVNFVGFVPHKDIPLYLSISDIFIRPSLSEGFGNSFIEAMASGIPVIATPVGGIVDFIKDGETGFFCEIKNPDSIVKKIDKIIKDKESRDYVVRTARDMVEKKYNWDLISKDMKNKVFDRMKK